MEATLTALAERVGINTMVELINNSEAKNLDSFQKDLYYDTMMLEKIKIGQENYVFLKYAKTYSIPKGHGKWTIRRNFPLTEHTVPLLEGVPPQSDKMKKERIEGTYHQYGRYMEFADRVDWKLLDPVIMEYASEYGDVATRTMHRLARKELLNTTFHSYANDKSNVGELIVGDYVGLADFRLMALKFARLAVRPIGGLFHVITSEEHYWDLMKDPLIMEYIGTNNGLSHYATGELPTLFGIKFMKTQMDEFAYGYELGNPGEFNDGADKCRIYFPGTLGNAYINIPAATYRKVYISDEYASASDFVTGKSRLHEEVADAPLVDADGTFGTDGLPTAYANGYAAATSTQNRLADGSWIPIRNVWSFNTDAEKIAYLGLADVTLADDVETFTAVGTSTLVFYKGTYATDALDTLTVYLKVTYYDSNGDEATAYEALGTLTAAANGTHVFTDDAIVALLPDAHQLPVHKAIMLGEDALARLEAAGEGNVKMYAKPKGSAGVLDPIDQRQSIGFKINAIGFKLVRPEACQVFHHVPTQATATAGISL